MYRVKLGGIYQIIHDSGYYYIGSSNDIPTRWGSHVTLLKQGTHHSPEFQRMWNESTPEEWVFRILKYISKTELRKQCKLKGIQFESHFRTRLLQEEKRIMKEWSINYCLNKNKTNFS